MNTKIPKNTTCYDLYNKKHLYPTKNLIFRPSVYGVLIENGKILLSKQWDGYDFPGGGIEIHETVEQALTREFFEETGLKIKPIKIVDCQSSFFYSTRTNRAMNGILLYYLVKKVGGKITLDNIAESEQDYIDLPEWVTIANAKKLKFYNSANNKQIINKAIKK